MLRRIVHWTALVAAVVVIAASLATLLTAVAA